MNVWIHCNSCFDYYDNSDRFYLVNCMHIFCRDCLNKRVIANDSKCCLCNKVVKYKRIDQTLEPKLATALETDQWKHLAEVTRNLDLGLRQAQHLHYGINKIEQRMQSFKTMSKELDEKAAKYKTATEKIRAQNKVLEQMFIEEKRKKTTKVVVRRHATPHHQVRQSGILSSSQNIRKIVPPSPLTINRSYPQQQVANNRGLFLKPMVGHPVPSITKLSSIRTRNF